MIFCYRSPPTRHRTMRRSFGLWHGPTHSHLQLLQDTSVWASSAGGFTSWVAETALLKRSCVVINKYTNGVFIALLGHFEIYSGKPFNSIKSTFVTRWSAVHNRLINIQTAVQPHPLTAGRQEFPKRPQEAFLWPGAGFLNVSASPALDVSWQGAFLLISPCHLNVLPRPAVIS